MLYFYIKIYTFTIKLKFTLIITQNVIQKKIIQTNFNIDKRGTCGGIHDNSIYMYISIKCVDKKQVKIFHDYRTINCNKLHLN